MAHDSRGERVVHSWVAIEGCFVILYASCAIAAYVHAAFVVVAVIGVPVDFVIFFQTRSAVGRPTRSTGEKCRKGRHRHRRTPSPAGRTVQVAVVGHRYLPRTTRPTVRRTAVAKATRSSRRLRRHPSRPKWTVNAPRTSTPNTRHARPNSHR